MAYGMFKKHDRDASNDIDVQELRAALQELGLNAPTEQQTAAILRKYDANGNGRIDIQEFLNLVSELIEFKKAAARDPVDGMFARFDINRNGSIDVAELRSALPVLGLAADTQQAKAVLDKYANGTGLLELDGFRTLVYDLRRFHQAKAGR